MIRSPAKGSTSQTTKPKARRRPTAKVTEDGDSKKRFPDSLMLVAIALHAYWLREIEDQNAESSFMSCDDFLNKSGFVDVYRDVKKLYPKTPHKNSGGRKQFKAIVSGASNMEYYKIRTIAKFVEVDPAGMILLYSQLVGEERRARRDGRSKRDAVVLLLDAVQRILDRTRDYIAATKNDGDDIFMRHYDSTEKGYLPDMAVLKMWRDAYRNGPTPPEPGRKLVT